MALVAPLAINTIDKAEAQSEYLSFCGSLRRASIKAFANGSGIKIELKQNTLRATINSTKQFANEQQEIEESDYIFEHTYKYIYFVETQLILNRNGLPNIDIISLTQRHKNRKIDLLSLLDN